ncbi:MAG: hypothetical protein CSA38_04040 [Flavobacteriales bacterium]|nr:MAG: hypothetical protein CSA38_04040 [Flavobacteriales bacterium]
MKAYYYLFYKLHNFWERASIPTFLSEFKASVSIIALKIWLIITVTNYYNIFIDRTFNLNKNVFLLIGFCIVAINVKLFTFSDDWKMYNQKFSQQSVKKNRIGGVTVWSIIICIIINLIYSYYLMSTIDWNQYRQ